MSTLENSKIINYIFGLIYSLIILLMASEFPILLTLLLISLCSWNIIITAFNFSKPKAVVVNCLAMLSLAFLVYQIGFADNVTLFVAMLLLSCLFKLLQARVIKNYQSISLLNFFSLSTVFLFSQSLYTTAIISLLIIANLSILALVEAKVRIKTSLKKSSKFILYALIPAIILLLFLPRIPAFWQLPSPKLAKTGLSENIDPFEIAKLSDSDELVFRAQFSGDKPSAPYYWRAIIHDEFNGHAWLVSDKLKSKQAKKISYDNALSLVQENAIKYQVYAEPSAKSWLYGLGFSASNDKKVKNQYSGTLAKKRHLNNISYSATSTMQMVTNIDKADMLSNIKLANNTSNPATKKLAKSLFSRDENPNQFYNALYAYFSTHDFSYTLTPSPITGDHPLDQFIFSNKRGFCGHYASAAAFMFRSVGIPARVVSGYLGGEYDQQNDYISVYQYDAHAWVEVYIDKEWKIFDATSVISPQRLTGSLSEYQQLNKEFKSNLEFGLLKISSNPMINWLRLELQNLDYKWTSWVLSFDQQKQQLLLKRLFGNAKIWQISLFVLTLVANIFVIYFIYINAQNKRPIPSDQLVNDYTKIVYWCEKQGLEPLPKQTPKEYLAYAGEHIPSKAKYFAEFSSLFVQVRYQQKLFTAQRKKQSQNLVKLIKTNTKRIL